MKKTVLIAVGNSLMCDDGVGIILGEMLENELTLMDIQVVIGETDIDYCFEEAVKADIIFILDAMYFGLVPGTVVIQEIGKEDKHEGKRYSQHGFNFLNLAQMYPISKKIYFIGIEINRIIYSFNLSNELNEKINQIYDEVLHFVEITYRKIMLNEI